MRGWRGRAVAAAVIVGLLAAAAWAVPAQSVPSRVLDGRINDWRGVSSRIGGSTQWSAGELVYQDHLFDDLGADTKLRAQQHGTAETPKGDYRYPTDEDRYGHNAADFQEVRLAPDGDDLWLLARLSTLKQADTTVVAFGFDVDGAAGLVTWPLGAGVVADGADIVVTLWNGGGEASDLRTGTTTPVGDVAVDLDDNAIEARVDRAILGGATAVRVWAAAGLWDASTSSWMAPVNASPAASARVFNAAFRSGETGTFMEELQANALSAGDITAFAADVDLDALESRAEKPFGFEAGHFYDVILDTGFSIQPEGEGVSYAGKPGRFTGVNGAALSQHFDFFGRYQPYGVYVPSTWGTQPSIPATLVLHGLGGSYASFNTRPGFLRDMGEGEGGHDPMFLITPLAHGSSFYADWGEADTIAALEDVFAHFPIDRDRLYLTGYSMGGYGVYRFASLHPDWFAGAAAWAGYTGEFTGSYGTEALAPAGASGNRGRSNIGDPVQTLENLRDLPLVHLSGTNDEIVPTPGQYAAPRRLSELGYESRYDLYPGYEHFSFALVDDWKQVRTWLGDRTRAHAPRQVDYRFSDGWTAPDLAEELGLVHDGAYWLRGLTMREPTEDGLVLSSAAATSWALPGFTPIVHRDPAPAALPTPHVQQLVWVEDGAPFEVANRLDLELTNVGSTTIDTDTAQLHACGLVLGITTDGPVQIRLGDRVPATAHLIGADGVASLTRAGDSVIIDVTSTVTDLAVSIDCRR